MSTSTARWSKIALAVYLCAAVLSSLKAHAATDDQTPAPASEAQAPATAPAQQPAAAPQTPAPAAAQEAAPGPVVGADGMTLTPSGLKYLDLAPGRGAAARPGNMVWVHYTGWLQTADGKKGRKFDSSYDRHEPLPLKLGAHQVIPGWEEGLNGLPVHAKRRLVIPPQLAYGPRGAGGGIVPPNATLIFDVEMMKIAQ